MAAGGLSIEGKATLHPAAALALEPPMIVTYLTPNFEFFAAYCRAQAGFYPGISKKARREAEIAAHRAGVRQKGRFE